MRNQLYSSSSKHHHPPPPPSMNPSRGRSDINNLSGMKSGLKRGPWTPEEDLLLKDYIEKEGEGRWRTLPKKAGLRRCGKSCRLRWMNYLRPTVKRGQIAEDEEDLILRLHRLLGNRWSLIAGRIPGRTDNEIKNYWNTHLSKKLIRQGIDPTTHKPLNSVQISSNSQDQPLQPSPNHNSIHHQHHPIINYNHDAPQNDNHTLSNINVSTTSSFSLPPHVASAADDAGGDYCYGDDDDLMGSTSLRFDNSSGGPSSTNTADQYMHVANNDDEFSSFMKTLINEADKDNMFSRSNTNNHLKMNIIADDDDDEANNFMLNNMLNPELVELWDDDVHGLHHGITTTSAFMESSSATFHLPNTLSP